MRAETDGPVAMRYYRLWIYTCNAALLAGALAFSVAAVRTVLLDYRRQLIPSLALYQPSFLYAYLALATQGGALQLLGCAAALRLSERLLHAYWLLLLVLLFGDCALGAFWVFRFERVCQELKPGLRIKLQAEYALGGDLTELWDRLQSETGCCGVTGPQDFNRSNFDGLPASCCSESSKPNCKPYLVGCEEKLQAYLRDTAALLFILGYCVLAFLKICFLGILRYEIREMIQKIRLLNAEMDSMPNANGSIPVESEALLGRPRDLGDSLLSSPKITTTPKNSNGNNNYEMREYRATNTNM